jgi:nucleotide-binding universal stress UspA family protein
MRSAPLNLVYIVATPLGGWGAWGLSSSPLPEDFGQRQEEEGRQIIADATRIAEAGVGDGQLQISTQVIFCPLVPTLIDLSKEAQMIVVGCRGHGALRRGLFGSVSTALVHHAHGPVAVIHDEAVPPGVTSAAPVLVGIDGSPASESAIAIAFDEASRRGVDLVALHSWSDADRLDDFVGVDWSAVRSSAEETLAERLAGWQERYPDVSIHRVVERDHPARHLLEQAEAAQLVVVGSHGRGGFAGMLLGSVATAVVHAARTPVIVVRSR